MFDVLFKDHDWKPIHGCPGRFILANGTVPQSITELFGLADAVRFGTSDAVPDPFEYIKIDGGGLISYKKDGGWLHTLCDTDGFSRKLELLGLPQEHA